MKLNSKEQKIFFTSDVHFGHKNIMSFCPKTRRGVSVAEMNQIIIDNWKDQVGPRDIVFDLGDLSFCSAAETDYILMQLPGRKFHIWGNHDRVIRSDRNLRMYFERDAEYMELKIDGIDVMLSHYPMARWNKAHYGSFHLHGHEHGNYVGEGRCLDVGIDTRPKGDMTLWTWEEIREYCEKRPIIEHH